MIQHTYRATRRGADDRTAIIQFRTPEEDVRTKEEYLDAIMQAVAEWASANNFEESTWSFNVGDLLNNGAISDDSFRLALEREDIFDFNAQTVEPICDYDKDLGVYIGGE